MSTHRFDLETRHRSFRPEVGRPHYDHGASPILAIGSPFRAKFHIADGGGRYLQVEMSSSELYDDGHDIWQRFCRLQASFVNGACMPTSLMRGRGRSLHLTKSSLLQR